MQAVKRANISGIPEVPKIFPALLPDGAVVTVTPEGAEGEDMPAARKEDALGTVGKAVIAAVLASAVTALGTNYVNAAKNEEKLNSIQRQLISAQDDLKTEREARELALRKIVALETQLRVIEQLERLNRNLESRRR